MEYLGDEELLALVADGDSSAFAELYVRHAGSERVKRLETVVV